MCGITGFFASHNLTYNLETIISSMTKQLIHRGPDDGAVWLNEADGIAMGHRRLAVIDLSATGHQPMHSKDGRYVIVYNGEVYNFLSLRGELQKKGHTFKGHSDTEVILTLIMEYGLERALTLMTGMFAFALWDKKAKTLSLARDRIGEKPLYYGLINHALVFGSELKALTAYPDFNNPIARSSVALLMQYGYIPSPHSIYEHIYKLPPASFITLAKGTKLPPPKSYWSAAKVAQEGVADPFHLTDAEAIAKTEALLHHVIKQQMVSDVPIGAFLSGGIDSSLITALMQANSSTPIRTFTIGFDAKDYNEAIYAKKVATELKTDHTEFYVSAEDALMVIPRLPEMYDEPFADSSAIPTFLVSNLTRSHVKVCLTGDGGDELFGGYNRYLLGKMLWKNIARLPYPMRLAMRKLLLSISPMRWHQLLKFTQLPMVGDKLHKFASIIAVKTPEHFYQQLISQWHETHEIVNLDPGAEFTPSSLFQPLEEMDFIEKMMVSDTLSYLPDDIMVKVDRAGMTVSLESRAPFLDHQLIEWMWKLPLNMKIRNRQTKWLLRQILAKYVSPALFERPKMGFGVPLDAWLKGPLREWAESLLNEGKIEQQGLLKAEPILKKWREHLSGKRNWQYQLWTVLMFQAWMEKYAN
jgi:asparagine synthase (glutamine-hydrolysing)